MIRERRLLLEQYLRSILTTKDPRWRSSYGFADFLAVPHAGPSRSSGGSGGRTSSFSGSAGADDPPTHFSPSTWLLEAQTINSLLRTARGALLKRDALAVMADASGSRTAGVEAKRTLRDVAPRIEALDKALGSVGMKGLGEGERRRREEMVESMRGERDGLLRMAEAGVRAGAASHASARAGSTGSGRGSPSPAGSAFAPSGTSRNMPGAFNNAGPAAPRGRFFGTPPPEETAETRPLDDRQLLQLQQTKMDGQNQQLGELSRLLQTQRKMGEEIHQEISEQNEMLDDLQSNVDRTEGKLGRAKRQLNRLN
jgi:regulator of vacuolar morphogenesis